MVLQIVTYIQIYSCGGHPTNDQDRISPYNINAISSRQEMRIKNVYPIPNSPN